MSRVQLLMAKFVAAVLCVCLAAGAGAQFVSPTSSGLVIANIFQNNAPMRDNSSSVGFPPGRSVSSIYKTQSARVSAFGEAVPLVWSTTEISGNLNAASTILGSTGAFNIEAQSEANIVIDFQLSKPQDVTVTVVRSTTTASGSYYANAAFDSMFPFVEGSNSFTRVFHCNPGFHRFVAYARVHARAQGYVWLMPKVTASFSLEVG